MTRTIPTAALAVLLPLAAPAADGGPWDFPVRPISVRLGVRVVETTDQLRKTLGVEMNRGALVLEVDRGGPASKGGLRAGDVLTRVAGEPVGDAGEIAGALSERKPGDQVTIEFVRDRQGETASVKLEKGRELRMGRWSFRLPEMDVPPGARRDLRRFEDNVERRLRELEERLRRLEKPKPPELT